MARRNVGGVGGPKRNKEQRALDRAQMVQLIRQGSNPNRIAEVLGIDRSQCYADWKMILKELEKQEQLLNPLVRKQLGLARLEQVAVESYNAWEASKQPTEKEVVESAPVEVCPVCAGDGHVTKSKKHLNRATKEWETTEETKPCWKCACKGEIGGVLKVTKTREGRLPDPRYLQLYGQALKEELALCGVTGDEGAGPGGVGIGGQQVIPWSEVIKKAVDDVEGGMDPVEAEIEAAARCEELAPEQPDIVESKPLPYGLKESPTEDER